MPYLNEILDVAPNWAIIAIYAVATAAIGLGVAAVTRRVFPHRVSAEDGGLADNVHMTVLYFAMFVLAIPISDARSNLGAASDIVEQEGFQVARLDRQLRRYGDEPTEKIRTDLAAYVHSITEGGWKVMAAEQGGTQRTRQILDRLTDEVYALAPGSDLQASLKPMLIESLDELDKQRELRLEKSTNTTPMSFWGVMFLLLFFGMVLSGRYRPTKTSQFYLASLLASFGVGMAFLAILDVPFRGETSVSQAPLLNAVQQIEAHLPPMGPPHGPENNYPAPQPPTKP